MTDSTAEAIVILAYRIVWFLALALVSCVLWNWVVTDVFGLPRLGLLNSFGLFALLRIVLDPPKLTVTRE